MLASHVEVLERELYGGRERGVFAKVPIREGEVVWESTEEVPESQTFHKLDIDGQPDAERRARLAKYSFMLEDDLFYAVDDPSKDSRFFFNHSCDPNCWYESGSRLVARRDIQPGEQVTLDYASSETEGSLHAGLVCRCGAASCRSALGFGEWRSPEWRRRYAGSCTAYIHRKSEECGWHDPRTILRYKEEGEQALFCSPSCGGIKRGEVVIVFAGKVVGLSELLSLPPREMQHNLQVHDGLWQVPASRGAETGDCVNHSCDANCGLEDSTTVVAMRDISAGEELTIDYGTVNSGVVQAESDNFPCRCGARQCRGHVTSADFRLPEVQERYWPYFPPFMKRLILDLRGGQPPSGSPAM